MKIKRLFCQNLEGPYDDLNFVKRSSQVEDQSIEMVVPESWGQTAIDILISKYRRRLGVPTPSGAEEDAREVFDRMARSWTAWAQRECLFDSAEDEKNFFDECRYMLSHQIAAPNSPQWFNTGLYESYGINETHPGHYIYDDKKNQLLNSEKSHRARVHACYIQSVEDNLLEEDGLMNLWKKEVRLFKSGSGSGTNFSKIREVGAPLSNGGKSSGLMAQLKVGDSVASAINSGASSRRPAKMVLLDDDHPEILEFINWKSFEEQKVACLNVGAEKLNTLKEKIISNTSLGDIKKYCVSENIAIPIALNLFYFFQQTGKFIDLSRLDLGWRSESYKSVSGQFSNNSIRLSHEFMGALKKKSPWQLNSRVSGTQAKLIEASQIWNELAENTWLCADPGVQFKDTINEWNTCPRSGEINASNPCSEYFFLDDTACNLASLNLVKFFNTEKRNFSSELFCHAVSLWTIVLDTSISLAQFPSSELARRSVQFRTLGLGFSNLGALFMRLGISYEDDCAQAIAGSISSLLSARAYYTSTLLASELGCYSEYDKNKVAHLKVLNNHLAAVSDNPFKDLTNEPKKIKYNDKLSKSIAEASRLMWIDTIKRAQKHGLRNAQVSAIAPTGTIGLVMGCDTTGIEPEYSLVKYKSLANSNKTIKIINQSVGISLQTLGLDSNVIDRIEEQILLDNSVLNCSDLDDKQRRIFKCAQAKSSDEVISIEGHLKILAAVQPFISGGISKTLNLAQDATIEDIKSIYLKSYELGLKSISIYRNNSKLSQPLTDELSSELSSYFEGKCDQCGKYFLARSGTCYVCYNCGTSTSCS